KAIYSFIARLLSFLTVFHRQPTPTAGVALSYFHPEPGRVFARGKGAQKKVATQGRDPLLAGYHCSGGFSPSTGATPGFPSPPAFPVRFTRAPARINSGSPAAWKHVHPPRPFRACGPPSRTPCCNVTS